MANGSQSFFDTIVVNWTYDEAKGQLTVSATLSGKSMGSTVLTSSNPTGQLQGTNGSNSATVGLAGNFSTRILSMNASQTDPQRNGQNQSSF